ncbi:MAG: DUF370 domain-containing protein [Lachnospiraceae bacterium]|jgi:extracellular matrix regulatory protein A|nr:DUF370 domain-containing protein [Lachnospiraceae bacterium]
MTKLLNIGFGNVINTEKIIAMLRPDSAPAKRIVQRAKEEERIIDATQGRRTRSIIIMETNQIVLSALMPETLTNRVNEEIIEQEGTGNE